MQYRKKTFQAPNQQFFCQEQTFQPKAQNFQTQLVDQQGVLNPELAALQFQAFYPLNAGSFYPQNVAMNAVGANF